MKLSIVATMYHSSDYVDEFHQRASAAAQALAGDDYEIVLVNDGSPDASLERAVALTAKDPHVTVVDLSRNFGHHKAMMTGLAHSHGDYVYLIDIDLEEEPEWLQPFMAQLEQDHCDVVFGVQNSRKGGWFERWTGAMFYRLMAAWSGVSMAPNMVTARVMTRRYVDALLQHEEREVDIGGLWATTGYDQRPQFVTKGGTSETTYTMARKIDLLLNSVTSFSNVPLIGIFYVGAVVVFFATLYMGFVIVQWAVTSEPVSGWTSLIVSVWLLGGIIIAFIGVIGIYLAKMFSEVKRRPYTIVRQIYGRR